MFTTVGHSTRSAEEIVVLLQTNDVRMLVDVRSRSRTNPQFNDESLPAVFEAKGSKSIYVSLGAEGNWAGLKKTMFGKTMHVMPITWRLKRSNRLCKARAYIYYAAHGDIVFTSDLVAVPSIDGLKRARCVRLQGAANYFSNERSRT